MEKLTKEEVELLKAFKNSPYYSLLKKIEEEEIAKLGIRLLSANLDDKNELEIIRRNQIYVEARKDFFNNVDKKTREISNPEELDLS